MIDETRFYSVAELKTETNAPRDLIYASLESGELHAIRRGRRWLIPGGAVLAWIRSLEGRSPP